MKNGLMMLSLIAATMVISCGPKEEKPTEVIVIEQPAEKPAPVEEKEGTTIEVDKNGVKVSSDKTSVDLKDGKAKVEVKD
jgi:hypothetical protein